jgi:CRP-like cAMP-binding protein
MQFSFFKEYRNILSDREWLSLGLAAEIKVFNNYDAVCKIFQPALDVYLILNGKIAVTKEKRYRYSKEILEGKGKILGFMKRGDAFGELGVLYGENRTASCVAIEKVTVIGFSSEIFKDILGDYVKDLNRQRFEILAKIKIFLGWDRSKLGGLLNHILVRAPNHLSHVYQRGQTNQNIYIIISGEIEISVPIVCVKT